MANAASATTGKGPRRHLRPRGLAVVLALSFLFGGLLPRASAQAPPGALPRQPYLAPPLNAAPATDVSYPANYAPQPGAPSNVLQAPSATPPAASLPGTVQPFGGQPGTAAPPPNLDPATRAWIEKLVNDRLAGERAAQAPLSANPAAQPPCGLATPSPCTPGDVQPYSLDFKDGVLFKTNDGMFSLRINNLLQVDYRDFSHTAQGVHTPIALQDNFTLARWWTYLSGNVTEFIDYQTVFAGGAAISGFGPANVNVLDAFIDINPFGKDLKQYFQIRVGRMKTPFLYQFYKLSPQDFVTPELSMYSTNFLQNRQLGIMAHGLVFNNHLDYAAGVFNGVPNSFDVVQSDREGIAYLGYYPFVNEKNSIFKNLLLAGSYAFGDQNGPTVPTALGTAVPANGPPNSLLISPTFLEFGPTTIQTGMHQNWAGEVIYALGSFNLYAEYTGGFQNYGLTTTPGKRYPVSLSGYSVAATYFLTGEEITLLRRRVQPLRPYNWKQGGLGAFEAFGRFSNLVLGSSVFADKLANPALFANSVNTTDIGVNWYLNQYIKFVFDWQHAMFNHEVSLTGAPGGNMTKNEDIFWLRFQMYY